MATPPPQCPKDVYERTGVWIGGPAMTPEQIARAVVGEPDWCVDVALTTGEIDFDKLRAHIAAAIRAERERIAQIVRASESELWAAGTDQSFIDGYKAALAGVFAAIRALP